MPLYPTAAFVAVAAESGVSVQPWGDAETRQGAINRTRAALITADADLAVGFEGGVVESEVGLLLCSWTAVVTRDGRLGIGGGGGVQLPERLADMLRAGRNLTAGEPVELGTAMDALTGLHNIKQTEGAFGILTAGLVNRQTVFELSLKLALAPFRSPIGYGSAAEGTMPDIFEQSFQGIHKGDS